MAANTPENIAQIPFWRASESCWCPRCLALSDLWMHFFDHVTRGAIGATDKEVDFWKNKARKLGPASFARQVGLPAWSRETMRIYRGLRETCALDRGDVSFVWF